MLAVLVLALLAQRPDAAAARQANLLQNPSFEGAYTSGAAANWGRWHENTARSEGCESRYVFQPDWIPETNPAFVLDGGTSQHVGNEFDTWHAGVYQNVAVTPGSRYRFSFWARGRASNENVPVPSDTIVNMGVRAGIDPNGSGTWNDSDVVWGGSGSPHDNWQQFSVEVTASAATISVFTSADYGGANQCRAHLDVWFDKAELVVVGPPPTNTSPPQPTRPPVTNTPVPPTDTPTPEVTPTDTPVPTDTPTNTPLPPEGGTICLNAFSDSNGNGLHEASEGYMAGVTFTIANAGGVVTQGISTGSGTPLCFEELDEGTYTVAQVVPRTLELTTAPTIDIDVTEGETVGLEFGSRIRPAEEPTQAVSEGGAAATSAPLPTSEVVTIDEPADEDGGTDWLAFSGLAVMLVAVLLLGVLIVLLLRQQRG
jgi:hypothetical protein